MAAQEQPVENPGLNYLHQFANEIYEYSFPVIRCVFEVLRYILKIIIQVLFFVVFILGVIHAAWESIGKKVIVLFLCQTMLVHIPAVSNYCKQHSASDDGTLTMTNLPTRPLVEGTVALAEQLAETNVSIPMKLIDVKMSLIDLKTSVLFGEIDQAHKNQLVQRIDSISRSITSATDEAHRVLGTFNSGLSKMEIYMENVLKLLDDQKKGRNNQNELQTQFEVYLQRIEGEIKRMRDDAENIHSILIDLQGETGTLEEIAAICFEDNFKELNRIQAASFIVKLYRMTVGRGNIDKVKHQRNLEILDQFPQFTKSASISLENALNRLRIFKHAIEEMKSTESQMDVAQRLSLDTHMEILQDGLDRLHEYNKRLNGRIKESNKGKE